MRLMPRGATDVGRKLRLAPRERSRTAAKASGVREASGLIPAGGEDRAEGLIFAAIAVLSLAALVLGTADSVHFSENWAGVARAVAALIG